MPEQSGDKTQDPTPHRRQQAREKGQVARSQDLGSAALLLGGVVLLMWLGNDLVDFLGGYTHRHLEQAWLSADVDFLWTEWIGTWTGLAKVMLPLVCGMLAVVITSNLLQVGLLFVPERLMPDLSRINPLQGFSRLFSLTNAVRLFFGIVKIAIVASVAYASLSRDRDLILSLVSLTVPQIAVAIVQIILNTTLKIAAALFILAVLDYAFQWWKQEQDLRMTTQEVREEMKNLQGDPQVISRRRAAQRQLALNRLSSSVPKSKVVVTNPTELAVAIDYDPATMQAPIVVAKGAGVLAQRIRRLALEHGIPIVEKKPLAQALYRDVDVNRPIPSQLYAAVAEVMAYVYQLKGGGGRPRVAKP